jgi:hypothetical protein
MSFRVFLIAVLLVAGAASGVRAVDTTSMGHPVYGCSGDRPATVLVRVVRDGAMRVRLQLIPAY